MFILNHLILLHKVKNHQGKENNILIININSKNFVGISSFFKYIINILYFIILETVLSQIKNLHTLYPLVLSEKDYRLFSCTNHFSAGIIF
jgi:hypothetical protein